MFTALFWKEVWVWLKNYWYWPVIATLFLVTLLGGSRLRSKFFDLLFKQRENYDKEIETLRRTAKEKEEKVQEVVESHTEELKIIEEACQIKRNIIIDAIPIADANTLKIGKLIFFTKNPNFHTNRLFNHND